MQLQAVTTLDMHVHTQWTGFAKLQDMITILDTKSQPRYEQAP